MRKIIENKKYNPPIHCIEDLHNIKPWSRCLILSKILKPVEVNPDTVSKIALEKLNYKYLNKMEYIKLEVLIYI